MIGRKSKKEEPAQVPASDRKIEETRARVDRIYWLMISLKLRLLKVEAMINQLNRDREYAKLAKELSDISREGGETQVATTEKVELEQDESFEEIDDKYPINYEPFVTYGSYLDLQDAADNDESDDLSKILIC